MREDVICTILFVDIAGSTRLYDTLGNTKAQSLMTSALQELSEVTEQHRGTVVKSIGDELMCTFPEPEDAVEAAKFMHRALQGFSAKGRSPVPLNAYVGIHAGPVIREDGDVFGDAVNLAARMVKQAKPRQIVTTQETVDALGAKARAAVKPIGKTPIKGKTGEMSIYEVVWEEAAMTQVVDSAVLRDLVTAKLELRLGEHRVEVGPSHPSATMGRQSHNDIVVESNRTSRTHARVEYRRGKFVLIDQSSNGTFLIEKGGSPVHLRHQEAVMTGSGLIGLGEEVGSDSPAAVHYDLKA